MTDFARTYRLDEGVVIEVFRFAPTLLPKHQLRVLGADLSDLLGDKVESFFPTRPAPLSGRALGVGADERPLHPIGVVDGLDLGLTLRAKRPVVAWVPRIPLELHDSPVDSAGNHSAVLFADPASGSDEVLDTPVGYRLDSGLPIGLEVVEQEGVYNCGRASYGGRSLHEPTPSHLWHPDVCPCHHRSLVVNSPRPSRYRYSRRMSGQSDPTPSFTVSHGVA